MRQAAEVRETLAYQNFRSALSANPHSEPGILRSEWIVRQAIDAVDNSASWIMRHPNEYDDPIDVLAGRLSRRHLPLDYATLTAMAAAMLDAYADCRPSPFA